MSSPIPDVQKAWIEVTQGTPKQGLQLKTDWPVSKQLAPGDVLVKIQAAALNPPGHKMLRVVPNFLSGRPLAAETDFAGVIVDSKDEEFKVGDEICGFLDLVWQRKARQGTLAEYVRVPIRFLMRRPPNLSVIEAAGVSLAGLTALQALDEAKLEEGQSVLINGGSTAVGSFAIQIAKARGATVTAVASGKNENYQFIDYTTVGPLHEYLFKNPPTTKYNVFVEALGIFDPSLYTFSKPYLAPNGIFVSAGFPQPPMKLSSIWDASRIASIKFLPSFLTGFKPAYLVTSVHHKRERISRMHDLLAEGKVKPLIDSVYEFEDVLKAYERILTKRATGKLVVKVYV
ncbi:GroES-like protein [Coprinopsis marcescibilis]|uniref:GroES-like protein n=1 Tax=Coprinopsis marcescibilis TaxID=230819 RepID=A0A5C3KJ03_COPMA|nr:GroES-like protein [Coprinopsis marcescibilis]